MIYVVHKYFCDFNGDHFRGVDLFKTYRGAVDHIDTVTSGVDVRKTYRYKNEGRFINSFEYINNWTYEIHRKELL